MAVDAEPLPGARNSLRRRERPLPHTLLSRVRFLVFLPRNPGRLRPPLEDGEATRLSSGGPKNEVRSLVQVPVSLAARLQFVSDRQEGRWSGPPPEQDLA